METRVNTQLNGNATSVNRELTGANRSISEGNDSADKVKATAVNKELAGAGEKEEKKAVSLNSLEGKVLGERYTVTSKLKIYSGEADIYRCECDGTEYIAKVYRRETAIKAEVVKKLLDIDSPYVSKLYATTVFDGCPVEILPYYKNGSLKDRVFTFEELKEHIIPDLNEGLKVLHDKGIIHKDLKPSNIMLSNNLKDVSIIDFGISSVMDSGVSVIVTKTGMTPEYSAPETYRSLFLPESDYYSLGITIYALFCGRTPLEGLSDKELEQYNNTNKIAFPSNMPQELQDLITGLTYLDIRNRKDKSNTNRRWTYDEVKKWCYGEKLVIPGEEATEKALLPYTFMGNAYNDRRSLFTALINNWDEGKKQLYRGLLSGFYKTTDPELAGICMDAEEATRKGADTDVEFFKAMYRACPDIEEFIWCEKKYKSLSDFGNQLMIQLVKSEADTDANVKRIFELNLIGEYCKASNSRQNSRNASIAETVNRMFHSSDTLENHVFVYYYAAHVLSNNGKLKVGSEVYDNPKKLVKFLDSLSGTNPAQFEAICQKLITKDGKLIPMFKGWLYATGSSKAVNTWEQKKKA